MLGPKLALLLILGFSKVRIGGPFGHDYQIILTESRFEETRESGAYASSETLVGQFFGSKREIHIRPGIELREMQRVLTHEIFIHGCYWELKMHDGNTRDEDQVANNIDRCIADTIRLNPELMRFLSIQIQ